MKRLLRRLSRSFALLAAPLLCLATSPALADGKVISVKVDPQAIPAVGSKTLSTFAGQIQRMVQELLNPRDPDLEIRIGSSVLSSATRVEVLSPDSAILTLEPGTFSFASNLNELAGLLAYEVSKLRFDYQRQASQLLADVMQKGEKVSTKLLEDKIRDLQASTDGPGIDRAEKLRKLRLALGYFQRQEKLRERTENFDSFLDRGGIRIDLSEKAKEDVQAAYDAVNRMAEGGYDPWAILAPFSRLKRLEYGSRGPVVRVMRKITLRKEPPKDTSQLENQVLENYLAYVEKRKVDIMQQPYRGQPLTPEQNSVRRAGTVVQTLLLGPQAREFLGISGFLGVSAAGAYAAVNHYLQPVTDRMVEQAQRPVPILPEPSSTDPTWIDHVMNAISRGVDSTVDGVSAVAHAPFIKGGGDVMAQLWQAANWPELGGVGGAWALWHFVARPGLGIFNGYSAQYFQRYALNLRTQLQMLPKLSGKGAAERLSAEELLELARLQEQVGEFTDAGRNPDPEDTASRLLYEAMKGGGFGWWSGTKKGGAFAGASSRLKAKYRDQAEKDLARESPGKIPTENQIRKRQRRLLYQDLVITPFLQGRVDSDLKSAVRDKHATSRGLQRFLYNSTGIFARELGSANSSALLRAIAAKLDASGLSDEDRSKLKEAVVRMRGLESYDTDAQKLYLDLYGKYVSSGKMPFQDTDTDALVAANEAKRVPPRAYRLLLIQRSKERSLTPGETLRLQRALVGAKLWTDAGRLFVDRLETFAHYGKYTPVPQDRKAVREAIDETLRHGNELQRWSLFWKALSLKDPGARLALQDRLGNAGSRVLPLPAELIPDRFFDRLFELSLDRITDPAELFGRIDLLSQGYGVDSIRLSNYALKRIEKDPGLLDEESAIDNILANDHYWKRTHLATPVKITAWEERILKNYQKYGERYEAYTYDPQFSERLQKLLLERRSALEKDSSLDEKVAFWKRLASRGASGFSDRYFEELFNQIQDPVVQRELAKEVFDRGLVWDQKLKSKMYQWLYQDEVTSERLAGLARDAREQFVSRTQEVANTAEKAAQGKVPPSREEYSAYGIKSVAQRLSYADPEKDLALRGRIEEWIRVARAPGAAKDPEAIRRMILQSSDLIEEGVRHTALMDEMKRIHEAFPESGYAAIELANWASRRYQTTHPEALYLKEQFIDTSKKGEDLGWSTINTILEESDHWSKPERWQLLRWLRGNGPPPGKLAKELKVFGPEIVRRMYSTLPIEARQALVGGMLSSPHGGLLDGMGKKVYYEQILNEILPRGQVASEIANEVLSSFLKATQQISNPKKRIRVLSYLLANHAEGSDVGTVLKRVCEAYGMVGVKLGQQLAASDILPPEVRARLAQLRDQANEPFWHEIHERLGQILETPNVSEHLDVVALLGSASGKYGILVREKPDGRMHVVQVKREEAEVSISREFKEADFVVEDLIRKNPVRYSFLAGMVSANKAAIWRELSLPRESEKANQAIAQYDRIRLAPGEKLTIPANTDLIDRLPGPESRKYALRSAEFAPGQSIDKLPPGQQVAAAEMLLRNEHDLLHPANDSETTVFDPDRHPGNELWLGSGLDETREIERQPIDWGQLLSLTREQRARIVRIMSYSQIFEHLGPVPGVYEKFAREFGLEGASQAAALRKDLLRFFPNRAQAARSGLMGYYYLLSQMEKHGFDRDIVNYDYIKAHYQLEPYEKLLKGRDHVSPKAALAEKVRKETARIAGEKIDPERLSRIQYALLHPRLTRLAQSRLTAIQKGEEVFEPNGGLEFSGSDGKERRPLAQPYKSSILGSVGNVYGAELVNAIFWSLHDRDPEIAMSWLSGMASLEKHAGFGAMAAASGLYQELTRRLIPLSMLRTRFVNEHGLSMAVGSVAADVVRRLLKKEDLDDILDHELSSANLKDLGYATLSYMAAELVVSKSLKLASRLPKSRWLDCRSWYRNLGKTALVFIAVEGLDRATRGPLTELGVLEATGGKQLDELTRKFFPSIQAGLAQVRQLREQGKCADALDKIGARRSPFFYGDGYDALNIGTYDAQAWSNFILDKDPADRSSFRGLVLAYRNGLSLIENETSELSLRAAAQRKIEALKLYLGDQAHDIFQDLSPGRCTDREGLAP